MRPWQKDPLLKVEHLTMRFGGLTAVDDVSFEAGRRDITALIGPNGAGKTTTFYMIIGLVKPDGGGIFLDAAEITDYPMHVRAQRGVGYLPQETSVFRRLTVRQNVMAVLELLPLSRPERDEQANRLLDELGIKHLSDQKANVLSGGECRRLEISRALATNPAFILLDEPFAGIDPLAVADIKSIIVHLKQRGIGILISDHNVRETLGVCDRAFIIVDGQVIEAGPPETIVCSEAVCRSYLGDNFKL